MQKIGQYLLGATLGKGGMATVYLAENEKSGVQVAVKVLNREYLHNENIRGRFFSEARHLMRLCHSNIVKVFDVIDQDGSAAFVMDYVEGESLKIHLERNGRLDDNQIKGLFVQMLEAVGYIHGNGLVHRDIKPSNFMIGKDGHVTLLDFGIVKTIDPSASEYTMTGTNQQMGTPMYMSPEQVKSTKSVDSKSDIYSLGVVLWQMVAGKKPYDTETLSTFDIQLKIVTESLEYTNTVWDGLIEKATSNSSDGRIPSCADFLVLLRSVPSGNSNSIDHDNTIVGTSGRAEETMIDGIAADEYLLEGSILNHGGYLEFGRINMNGVLVILPEYSEMDEHRMNGRFMYRVKKGSGYGIIDVSNNWVVDPIYEDVGCLGENLFEVHRDGMCMVLNDKGATVLADIDSIEYRYGWLKFGKLFSFGLCDVNGKVWIDALNKDLIILSKNLLAVKRDKSYGIMDTKGDWLVKPSFVEVKDRSINDLLVVKKNKKWGVIDSHGNWIIKPEYYDIVQVNEDLFIVTSNRKSGVLDSAGRWVLKHEYEYIYYSSKDTNRFYARKNKKQGVYGLDGKLLIRHNYDHLSYFDPGGYCGAVKGDLLGFIDESGQWIIKPKYEYFGNGETPCFDCNERCIIYTSEGYIMIDRRGEKIIGPSLVINHAKGSVYLLSHLQNKYGYTDKDARWIIEPAFDLDVHEKIKVLVRGFDHSSSIHTYENLPLKKVVNFKRQFPSIDANSEFICCYYDATFWGKGDNGFAVTLSGARQYLYISLLHGVKKRICLSNDGICYLTKCDFIKGKGMTLEFYSVDDRRTSSLNLGFDDRVLAGLTFYLTLEIEGSPFSNSRYAPQTFEDDSILSSHIGK
jgi:serine/threonine protein kinase